MELIELIALLSMGAMAGATTYISVIEVPARAKMPPAYQLVNWQSVFPPSMRILKPFGIVAMVIVFLAGIISGNWLWFVSALLLAALGPFTAKVILPTNNKLLALKSDASENEIKPLISAWGWLHNIRTYITVAAFIIGLFAS